MPIRADAPYVKRDAGVFDYQAFTRPQTTEHKSARILPLTQSWEANLSWHDASDQTLEARDHLAPGGLFAMYNLYREPWLVTKLDAMLGDVFGGGRVGHDPLAGHVLGHPLAHVLVVAGDDVGVPVERGVLARALQPDLRPPEPPSRSIAAQVDEILQEMLHDSPYASRLIRLIELPSKGLVVMVGQEEYEGVEAVPDEDIRRLIRLAVAEWERRVTE